MSGLIKNAGIVGTIEELLASFNAGEKTAEANTEAGGYTGGTTHPVKDVDDRTEDATQGARSAENTEDVKSEPNRGVTVDETTPGPGAGQASVQTDIGMTSKETGTDPTVETNSAKSGKEDPGSSHPARTDNDALDGNKYASDYECLRAMWKRAEDLGSQLCAKIANDNFAGTPAPAPEAKQAAEAGADLANIFAGVAGIEMQDKVAADAVVVDALTDMITLAHSRAEKTAELYSAYLEEMRKQAEGEELPPEDPAAAEGGAPPAEGGGGEGGDAEAALLALLAGQGGGEGGGEGDIGAEDALAGMAGGDAGGMPPDAAGGMPGGMPGEGGGEGGGDIGPEELAMLEQILQQEGIDPAELEAATAGKQAACAAKKPAKPKWTAKSAADRQKYAYMLNYVRELTGRSRA